MLLLGFNVVTSNFGHFSWYIFTCRKVTSYLYQSLTSSHSYPISYTVWSMSQFIFLQNFPHLLICYMYIQVVTSIHLLSICTVELVDTSPHLPHLNFNKVMTKCVHTFSCSVVSFRTNGHFFWLTFTTTSVSVGNSISYLYLTICQSTYHVATVGGQNEWGNLDLQFRTRLIQHIIFLQDLPHILVCCMQVDTGFLLLNIFTVDTSQHLCHHNLLSKVLLIYDHLVVVFILCQAK